jgi:hypothetical protein
MLFHNCDTSLYVLPRAFFRGPCLCGSIFYIDFVRMVPCPCNCSCCGFGLYSVAGEPDDGDCRRPHPDSLHAGMEVAAGEKWAFNLW